MSTYRTDVKSVVENYLIAHGYDGLADDDCGCGINDLMPCCMPSVLCRPAYKAVCKHCGEVTYIDAEVYGKPGYKFDCDHCGEPLEV